MNLTKIRNSTLFLFNPIIFSKLGLSWKWQRLVILLFVDSIIVYLCYWSSFFLRFDDTDFGPYQLSFQKTTILALAVHLIVYLIGGMYRQVWRYANYQSALLIGRCTVVATLIFVLCEILIYQERLIPRSIPIIHLILCFLFIGIVRYSWAIIRTAKIKPAKYHDKDLCLIYGAGNSGELFARYVKSNPNFPYKIIGFIDDSIEKKGHILHGFKILGGRNVLRSICMKHRITKVIIAIHSLSGKHMREIVSECLKCNIKPLVMPEIESVLGDDVINLRQIDERDLLKRTPKPISREAIHSYFKDQCVLVTGAGGSIGSEICQQILASKPSHLLLFDSSEFNLYSIEQSLHKESLISNTIIIPILGSITNRDLVSRTLKKFKPKIILHAAAYKHVPIVELNPIEGILNNVYGTMVLSEESIKNNVDKFILISSDKAVRPTNIMGMTKRCCELLIQSMNELNQSCQFSAVRFGNVLCSSGSVIPRFLEQIKIGGPVTVTHKDVTRFFMLTEEAVSLVLQTVFKSKGGEIFVLDMGEPVKIYEMAKQLIRMNGKEPNIDIDIDIIGLRPGEKLYEELIIKGVEKSTLHDNIFITTPTAFSSSEKYEQIYQLVNSIKQQQLDQKSIINHLKSIIDESDDNFILTSESLDTSNSLNMPA